MKLTFKTHAEAQAVSDRIFAEGLAEGAWEPYSTGWSSVQQDLTEAEQEAKEAFKPVVAEGETAPLFEVKGKDWYIFVEDKCEKYMKAEEVDKVPEMKERKDALAYSSL